jgi:hypothetical protein
VKENVCWVVSQFKAACDTTESRELLCRNFKASSKEQT